VARLHSQEISSQSNGRPVAEHAANMRRGAWTHATSHSQITMSSIPLIPSVGTTGQQQQRQHQNASRRLSELAASCTPRCQVQHVFGRLSTANATHADAHFRPPGSHAAARRSPVCTAAAGQRQQTVLHLAAPRCSRLSNEACHYCYHYATVWTSAVNSWCLTNDTWGAAGVFRGGRLDLR
jgi:hypothetical protein